MTFTQQEIDAQAESILQATQIIAPPIDLARVARYLNVTLEQAALPIDISGFLHREGDTATIVINSKNKLERQRFTVAHEMGHLVFNHMQDQVHVDKTYLIRLETKDRFKQGRLNFRLDSSLADAYDPEERQANAFAGALLMPATMLEVDLESALRQQQLDDSRIEYLAERYRVSIQALLVQLNTLNVHLTLAP